MIFHNSGGPGASPEAFWRRYQKKHQKFAGLRPFCEAILDQVGSQIRFFFIFCVSIFVIVFGVAFGRPPVPIFRIWGSLQGAFLCHFEHFFADAAKLKKCNPFKRNAWFGRCWASVFAFVLLTFWMCFLCCCLDCLFVRFLRSWASKGGPFWSPFSQILQILEITERGTLGKCKGRLVRAPPQRAPRKGSTKPPRIYEYSGLRFGDFGDFGDFNDQPGQAQT